MVQCFLEDILIGVETLDELKKKLFTKTKEVSVEGIRLCQDKVKDNTTFSTTKCKSIRIISENVELLV